MCPVSPAGFQGDEVSSINERDTVGHVPLHSCVRSRVEHLPLANLLIRAPGTDL